MDSTTPSTASATAAVGPAALRSCPKCCRRMSDLQFDLHTICESCRGIVCSLENCCPECKTWSLDKMSAYLKHKVSLAGKRRSRKSSTPVTTSPAVASSPSSISHIRLPPVTQLVTIQSSGIQFCHI